MTVVKRSWPSEGGKPFDAFVAPLIAEKAFSISDRALEACDQALSALSQIGAQSPVAWDPVGRLLLSAEGLASSDIEGIRVGPRRLLQATVGDTQDEPATWVLDNIDAIEAAYDDADKNLTTDMVLRWHETLMSRSPLPREYVGAFREVQGWIGGMDPTSAVYVPAPPEFIEDLMKDLVGFANRRDIHPVWQAAVLHAQFETIHPFADGNGRVGRALIGWTLGHRRVVTRSVPPLSPVIARQTDRYVHGLWLYRDNQIDPWVTWFADICLSAANRVAQLADAVVDLVRRWEADLSDLRVDNTSRRLLAELPATPITDVNRTVAILGVSHRSARSALRILEERGVLQAVDPVRNGPGRPRKLWVAGDLVDLL